MSTELRSNFCIITSGEGTQVYLELCCFQGCRILLFPVRLGVELEAEFEGTQLSSAICDCPISTSWPFLGPICKDSSKEKNKSHLESTLFNTTRDYIAHSRSPCSKMESLQQTHCHKLSVSLFTDQIALGNYSNHSRTRLKIGYLNMGTNPTESCKSTNQHIIHHFNLHMTLGITLYPPPAENSICFLSLLKK